MQHARMETWRAPLSSSVRSSATTVMGLVAITPRSYPPPPCMMWEKGKPMAEA